MTNSEFNYVTKVVLGTISPLLSSTDLRNKALLVIISNVREIDFCIMYYLWEFFFLNKELLIQINSGV